MGAVRCGTVRAYSFYCTRTPLWGIIIWFARGSCLVRQTLLLVLFISIKKIPSHLSPNTFPPCLVLTIARVRSAGATVLYLGTID